MQIQSERIQYLLRAYSDKTATAAEEQELLELIAADSAEATVITYIRALLEQFREEEHTAQVDWEQLYHKILQQRNEKAVVVPLLHSRKRWFRFAAAAAILVIAGAVWFWQTKEQRVVSTTTITTTTSQTMIDSNKIILTLSDGQVIAIDSNAKGNIADPESSGTINLDHGQLAYGLAAVQQSSVAAYNTVWVPRGRQYELTLPDGTHVWLNAESSLRFPIAFGSDKREVFLSGEAYFDVKNSSTLPFFVNAGAVKVQALGTGFNVMAYHDEGVIATTLVNGSVKVISSDSVVIKPGEQALVNRTSKLSVSTADLASVLAWRNGEFKFDGLSIKEIMRQLTRWYNIDVVYQGEMPTNDFYGIFPRKWNAVQILDALELAGNVHFKTNTNNNTIVVIPGPDN